MALVQAFLSLISRSAGKILNAIFGWAVVALFGQITPKEKTVLSGLVALAAAWPLLLLGIAFPRVAALVLAFIPPSAQGPSRLMRIIWLALAITVPVLVGLAVAAKAPRGAPREPFVKRALRGFPITLGLACAFLLTFVTVPFMRLASALKKRKDEHVPLVTDGEIYDEVVAHIDNVLETHGIDASRAEPPWWLSAPTKLLLKLGGKSFRGYVPQDLAYWAGPRIEMALYPSDLLLRGARGLTSYAHGLIVEDLVRTRALQTFEPAAQEIEKEIRRVFRVFEENPDAHAGAPGLLRRLREISDELATVDLPYDEWAILYRQCAQLGRALAKQQQLLAKEKEMPNDQAAKRSALHALAETEHPEELSSVQLVAATAREAITLLRSEVELAKAELTDDIKSEAKAAKGLSVAAVAVLIGVNMLFVAGVFGLAQIMPAWGAALVIGGALLLVGAIAGAIGWKHVRAPLRRTRQTLKEDLQWVKERTA